MRTDFLFLSATLLATSSYALPPPTKRQGLFSCSGWGASCMSGWSWRPRGQGRLPAKGTQLLGAVPQKLATPPRVAKPKYWLTTERTWGPMGKRSRQLTVPKSLNALLNYYIVSQKDYFQDQPQLNDLDSQDIDLQALKTNLVDLQGQSGFE